MAKNRFSLKLRCPKALPSLSGLRQKGEPKWKWSLSGMKGTVKGLCQTKKNSWEKKWRRFSCLSCPTNTFPSRRESNEQTTPVWEKERRSCGFWFRNEQVCKENGGKVLFFCCLPSRNRMTISPVCVFALAPPQHPPAWRIFEIPLQSGPKELGSFFIFSAVFFISIFLLPFHKKQKRTRI